MHAQTYANTPGYLFIFIGILLSVISALVPHFEAGYKLMTSVFIAGMLPYIVYAIAVPLFRGTLVTVVGLVIAAAHTYLVLSQRFVGNADYSDGWIYFGPMGITVAVIPLVIIVFIKSAR